MSEVLKTASFRAYQFLSDAGNAETAVRVDDFTAIEVACEIKAADESIENLAASVGGYLSRCVENDSMVKLERQRRDGWQVYLRDYSVPLPYARDMAKFTRRTKGCASEPELPSKYAIADRLRAIADDLARFPMSLGDYSTDELLAELRRRAEGSK